MAVSTAPSTELIKLAAADPALETNEGALAMFDASAASADVASISEMEVLCGGIARSEDKLESKLLAAVS